MKIKQSKWCIVNTGTYVFKRIQSHHSRHRGLHKRILATRRGNPNANRLLVKIANGCREKIWHFPKWMPCNFIVCALPASIRRGNQIYRSGPRLVDIYLDRSGHIRQILSLAVKKVWNRIQRCLSHWLKHYALPAHFHVSSRETKGAKLL